MPDKQLGFIGVGRMGQHMASRLHRSGLRAHHLRHQRNRDAAAGTARRQARDSAADVASQCETVLVSLPTPDIVKAVALGKRA